MKNNILDLIIKIIIGISLISLQIQIDELQINDDQIFTNN
jgi:hypothetical protein